MFIFIASAMALASPRPPATDTWALVDDTALMCAHPGRQGPCARFRQPGAVDAANRGPRVFRIVSRAGGEVEIQSQVGPTVSACGITPFRITSLSLRVWVPESAVRELSPADSCFDAARPYPEPGRSDPTDPVGRLARGTRVSWPDGTLAGITRWDLVLTEEHAPYVEAGRTCATFMLGPDDGGAVGDRAFDLCFDSAAFAWMP
ncbi:MAG: hypothetical protein D6798_19250 [Deltaproteobacteria bacterium]|nr:MAG: hypothetical protein D6798_19250 [Deltaproteobacteria bacterium]